MDILIIGGSRFIGPILVDELLKNNHQITIFNRGNIKSNYGERINFIKGDRNDGFRKLRKPIFDAVIDMCAYLSEQTKAAIDQLSFDFFLNVGTAASYNMPQNLPLTEKSPLGDWSLWGDYNKGKVGCEKVLRESRIKFATIRPVYVLGPKNYVDREHFIYSKIKNQEPILIPGDGQALVQFVFAKDVAKSIALLAEGKKTGAFNCAGDEIISLVDLVNEMGKIVGKKPIIKFNPDADGENFKEGEFPFANQSFFCSNKKLKKLGIEPTQLTKGLKENYENYYKYMI
ncbi:NAD-dependent epimerase/dehydratase family protein [Candidatus Micrarchaeota archaeon]|nr:NAD-dependent epimerase/dehydratase family protein [Candidatus Micrarchaeota archaeon]